MHGTIQGALECTIGLTWGVCCRRAIVVHFIMRINQHPMSAVRPVQSPSTSSCQQNKPDQLLSLSSSPPLWSELTSRGYVGHCAPYFEFAVCSVEKCFFKKQTGFGTDSQSLIWPWDLRDRRLPMTTLPSLTGYFWFPSQLDYKTLKNNSIRMSKWPLADVFLLVLSQFRLSHIRPLGAINSLIGFCMCSAQTFATGGHLIIMDRHHGNYGTHTAHMWNRCYSLLHQQTSGSPEKTSTKKWYQSF